MNQYGLIIGIDPGVNTGWAYWSPAEKEFMQIETINSACALGRISDLFGDYGAEKMLVIFEDARQRQWFGDKGREALQGAGSIKRECQIWADWLELHGIEYRAVSPKAKGAKLSAEQFAKLTGWHGRTSQHARDAAMLVWGM